MDLIEAADEIQRFQSGDLRRRIAAIEQILQSTRADVLPGRLDDLGVTGSTLAASLELKRAAGQVNVLVHTLGILAALPAILEPDEVIEYVSLGAGNTGRNFDLETDRRVAEFKFINWRGGPEAIRQNQLFKDFYLLEAHETPKRKQVFVLGDEHPLRFFNGGRALASVMSRNGKLGRDFQARFESRFTTVREYYTVFGHGVEIVDLNRLLPGRFSVFDDAPDDQGDEVDPI